MVAFFAASQFALTPLLPLRVARSGGAAVAAPLASLALPAGVGGEAAAAPRLRLRRIAGRGGTMELNASVTLVEAGCISIALIAEPGDTPGFRGLNFSAASGDHVWRQQLYGVDSRPRNQAHVVRSTPGGGMASPKDARVVAGDTLAVYGKAVAGKKSPHLARFAVELVGDAAAHAPGSATAAAQPAAAAAAAKTPVKVPFGADKPVLSGSSDERHDRRRCSSLLKGAAAGGGGGGAAALGDDAAMLPDLPDAARVADGTLPQPVRAFPFAFLQVATADTRRSVAWASSSATRRRSIWAWRRATTRSWRRPRRFRSAWRGLRTVMMILRIRR